MHAACMRCEVCFKGARRCPCLLYSTCAEGKVAAYLEERVNPGVNFILSAEIDHAKKVCGSALCTHMHWSS
jgi:hypothetical protein